MKRRDPKHEAYIRSLMCMRCPCMFDIQCAHIRKFSDAGMGLKPSAKFCVPLCHDCHIKDQHQYGEITFWNGEDGVRKALQAANALYEVTGDVRAGTQIVIKARQEIWA